MTDVMRPWEETWTPKPANDGDPPTWYVVAPTDTVVADTIEEPFARLVAAAPEMARLLLSMLEHAEDPHGDGGKAGFCPVCHVNLSNVDLNESDDHLRDLRAWHHDDCRLMAALRKAGVLPTDT